jgi:hypothetical protein
LDLNIFQKLFDKLKTCATLPYMKNPVAIKLVKHVKSASMVSLVRDNNVVYCIGSAGVGTLFNETFPSNAKAKAFMNSAVQV